MSNFVTFILYNLYSSVHTINRVMGLRRVIRTDIIFINIVKSDFKSIMFSIFLIFVSV